jgi:hypothetical protein
MKFLKEATIRINQKYLEDYDILCKGKDKSQSPFQGRKHIFLASVAYGYLNNKSAPVKNGHDAFKTGTFTIDETIVLKSLFLKKNKMNFDNNFNEDNIIKQAMEWAEAGFVDLRMMTIANTDSNLSSILEELEIK